MKTLGTLAVIALLVLLQVTLSVQRPPRNERNEENRPVRLEGEGRRNRQRGGRRELCGAYNSTTEQITTFNDSKCDAENCTKIDFATNDVFCKCKRRRGSDTDGNDDGVGVDANGNESFLRQKRSPRGGRRSGSRRRSNRQRSGRRSGGKKERTPCGTYDPENDKINLNVSVTCRRGSNCSQVNETTNQVFCKCKKERRHDSRENDKGVENEGDTNEDEQENNEGTDDTSVVLPRKKRAAGRRFGHQRSKGGKGQRRRKPQILCGTYDPVTKNITLTTNDTCSLEKCTKVNETTNQVFCECRKGRRRGDRDDETDSDEVDDDNEDDDNAGADDGDVGIDGVDVVLLRKKRGLRRFLGLRNRQQKNQRQRNGRRQRGNKPKILCGTFDPVTNNITLIVNETCSQDRCTDVNETTYEVFCKGRGRKGRGSRDSDDNDEVEGETLQVFCSRRKGGRDSSDSSDAVDEDEIDDEEDEFDDEFDDEEDIFDDEEDEFDDEENQLVGENGDEQDDEDEQNVIPNVP